jgi:hypothetical protein
MPEQARIEHPGDAASSMPHAEARRERTRWPTTGPHRVLHCSLPHRTLPARGAAWRNACTPKP